VRAWHKIEIRIGLRRDACRRCAQCWRLNCLRDEEDASSRWGEIGLFNLGDNILRFSFGDFHSPAASQPLLPQLAPACSSHGLVRE
jgi:hypothetical protein